MKKYNNILMACLMVLLAGFFIFFSAVPSATAQEARIVEVGTGSGNWGGTVTLPISVDNPSGIGGLAFSLNFDPNIFEFVGVTKASKIIDDGSTYKETDGSYVVEDSEKPTVGTTLFYQTNADNTNGKVLVAAASATAQTQTTKTALLNAQFKIRNSGSGDYTIGIVRSIIDNPAAGYNGPTLIPVLVGVPTDAAPDVYPQYATTLKNGKITVSAASTSYRTINGTVKYGDDTSAINGTPVDLHKKVDGVYSFDSSTTVKDGNYSFSKKLDGDYRVFVSSLNPNFYNARGDITVTETNTTLNIVLPSPERVSGKLNINGQVLPGLRVKVVDSKQNVVGIFPVNADGSFSSGPLPQGTYTTYAVYGSLETLFTASDTVYNWETTLRSITGTISGLDSGVVTVTASSSTGFIVRTDNVTLPGDTAYEIANLVPAANYKVSATVMGQPVQYYNNKTDIFEADSVDISAGNNTADFNFTSTAMATISGTVTEGGAVLDDIMQVFAFNVNTYALVSADTNATGDYSLTVAPGAYEIFAMDDGTVYYYSTGGATTNWFNLSVVTVTATQNLVDIDIAIPTPCDETLTGKVTFEGGDPVAFALVVATSQEDMAMTITGLDGTYTLTGLCVGHEYTIEMDPITGNYGIQTETITAGTNTTLDFIIDTGNIISGTITGTSAAIANAMIYLIDQETEMLVGGRMYYSDNSGVYTINDIPDGVYTMVVSYPGYGVYEENDISLISDDLDKNIQLEKGYSFKGTVYDGNNSDAPLSGALIIVTGTDVTPMYAVTGSDGTYEIGGLSNGSYVIIAQKRDYVRQILPTQTPAEGGATVNFTLVKPDAVFNLSGTITSSAAGAAVSDAIVIVSSASKNFFAVTTTKDDGTYSFTDLLEATDYRYVVIPGGDLKPVESTGKDTTGATNETWDVLILSGSTISGTITFSSGTAYVFLYKYDTNDFVDYTTAGTGGAYEFAGLEGNYKVFAVAGSKSEWYSGADISSAGSVAAGTTGVNIDLTDN